MNLEQVVVEIRRIAHKNNHESISYYNDMIIPFVKSGYDTERFCGNPLESTITALHLIRNKEEYKHCLSTLQRNRNVC